MKNQQRILTVWLQCVVVLGIAQGTQFFETEKGPAYLLSEYIQIESVSGNEKNAGDFLAEVCRQKGLHVAMLSSDPATYNFSASLYPLEEGKPNIVLLNHIDVVPEGPEADWNFQPYSGLIEGGKVYGRGAIDMKGMAIMQLLAIQKIKTQYKNSLPYNVTLLSVSGEEKNNAGTREVIANYFDLLNPLVVYGEGGAGVSGLSESKPDHAFFAISTAEKKALWLELKLRIETSGHASIPPLDYSNRAIIKSLNRIVARNEKMKFDAFAVTMLKAIGKQERGIKRFVLSKPRLFKMLIRPSLQKDPLTKSTLTNTISITGISNPEVAVNQIPQEVVVTFDCRLLPSTDPTAFLSGIKKSLADRRVDVNIIQQTPTASPSEEGFFFLQLRNAVQQVYPAASTVSVLFPAYSDNSYFRERQVPVYGLNPVHLSTEQLVSVHGPNEFITIDQLERGSLVYFTLLHNILEKGLVIASRPN